MGTVEERAAFAERLRRDDGAELIRLIAELRCCSTGEGVKDIEGDEENDHDGTVVFNFRLPTVATGGGYPQNTARSNAASTSDVAATDGGSLAFFMDEGLWRAQAAFSQLTLVNE